MKSSCVKSIFAQIFVTRDFSVDNNLKETLTVIISFLVKLFLPDPNFSYEI